jgi:hypothetical protein
MNPRNTETTSPRAARAADLKNGSETTVDTNGGLTSEQLARWAQLVADGQEAFPDEHSSLQRQQMLEQVRTRRRARLVNYICQQVARDIHRGAAAQHGG